MWANANVMAALLNIGGALFSTPQSLADATTKVFHVLAALLLPRRESR